MGTFWLGQVTQRNPKSLPILLAPRKLTESISPGLKTWSITVLSLLVSCGFLLCTPINGLVKFLHRKGRGLASYTSGVGSCLSSTSLRVVCTQGGGNPSLSRVLPVKKKQCNSDRVDFSLVSDLTGIPILTKVRKLCTVFARPSLGLKEVARK